MPKFVDVSQLGDKRVSAKLARLDIKVQKKIVRQALRKAAAPILATAKARVAVDTGALRDGLTIRAVKAKKGVFGIQVATPRRAELGIPADAKGFYPAVLEYGSVDHPPKPYLRPALEQNRDRALATVADFVRDEIEALAS